MGRAGHASCARSMLGANAIPSDNASPARCFIAFSFCFCNRKKQVLCRVLEFLEFQVVSRRLLQSLSFRSRRRPSGGFHIDRQWTLRIAWICADMIFEKGSIEHDRLLSALGRP